MTGGAWVPLEYHYNGSAFCGFPKKLSEIQRPGNLIMVGEPGIPCPDAGTWCRWWWWKPKQWHLGGKIYIFADAHVKWLRLTQTVRGYTWFLDGQEVNHPYELPETLRD